MNAICSASAQAYMSRSDTNLDSDQKQTQM
jgi:hypothetical protein